MSTCMKRRGVAALTTLCLTLSTGLLVLSTACASNDKSYDEPAPAISAFTTGTMSGTTFTATRAGTTLNVLKGSSAWFRANFGVKGGSAVLMPGNVVVPNNVPFEVKNLQESTTFTLTVTSAAGKKATASVPVTVSTAPTGLTYDNENATYYVGVQIAANRPTVNGSTPMTYSVAPELPTGLSLDPSTGIISGTPTATAVQGTFTITAKNAVGEQTKDIKIAVQATPITFTAPSSIAPGQGLTLAWDASSPSGLFTAVEVSADPADSAVVGPFALKGSLALHPATTTTYTLRVTGVDGGTVTRTVIVTVGSAPVSNLTLQAEPAVTTYGGTSTLTWSMAGAPAELFFTDDPQDQAGASNRVVSPQRRQTYVLRAKNALNSGYVAAQPTGAGRGLEAFAGNTDAGGCVDGTGSAAKFLFATSVAGTTGVTGSLTLGGDGNLYVADTANHVVRRVSPTGVVTTLAGKPGVAFNQATDGDGSGIGSAARFDRPAQVLYIDENTLYVSDYGSHSLRRLDRQPDGSWAVSVAAGTPGTYGNATTQNLDNPLGIAAYNGKLYIADMYTSTIRVYDPSAPAGSRLSTLAGSGTYGYKDGTGSAALFRDPSALCIDPANGDIYVADRENHAIRKVTQAGVVTTVAGAVSTGAAPGNGTSGSTDGTGTAARFNRPCAIARGTDGTFYISDYKNHTIRRMSATFEVSTLAGKAGTYGFAEGTGQNALFNGPQGLAVDASGALLVADSQNFHLRKLTPSGSPAVYQTSPFAGRRMAGLVNGAAATAQFNTPNGVAVSKTNYTYVADERNACVRRIAPDGTVETWGTGYTFAGPAAVCVDQNENVYVTDRSTTALTVVKITPDGTAAALALTGATPDLGKANGRGIAVNPEGTALFVSNGDSLQKFDLGTLAQVKALTVKSAYGLALDKDTLYWVENYDHYDKATKITTYNYLVRKADLGITTAAFVAGTANTVGFQDGAVASASFNAPVSLALALGSDGIATHVFVVDQGNAALRAINLKDATVETLVGAALVTGAVPGILGNAGLYWPKGVAITPAGDLLVTTSDGLMQLTAPLNK